MQRAGFYAGLMVMVLCTASPASGAPFTVTGVFTSTTPGCGTGSVVCSGVGTSSVSWGEPVFGTQLVSSLTFFPSSPNDVEVGEVFTLGTLRLGNGTAQAGTWIKGLTLEITTTSAVSTFNQVLTIPITAKNTQCFGGEPVEQCADYIYFPGMPGAGSFRVWEGFFGTVQVLGRFGSLHLEGFGNVTGVGFIDATTGAFGPEIDPSGLPPELQVGFVHPTVNPLPEPAVLGLIGLGGALVAVRRRRRG